MLKKYFLCIITGIILAILFNLCFAFFISPGHRFFSDCLDRTKAWEKTVRKSNEPCYIFAGGSEVRMGIEPIAMLKEHGIRAINAGVQAGNGIRCNAQMGLDFLREGDTLVLSIFADPFSNGNTIGYGATRDGITFSFLKLGLKCLPENGGIISFQPNFLPYFLLGSSSELSVYLMRILTRPGCIYRYSNTENARITESGRVEVFIRNRPPVAQQKNPAAMVHQFQFDDLDALIKDTQAACRQRGAKLVVYLPRNYISSDHASLNAVTALHLTDLKIPVLRDPFLGTCEDSRAYSDTDQHLSIEEGYTFSAYIAKLLKEEDYWTRDELVGIILQP